MERNAPRRLPQIARILSRRPPLGKAATQFELWRRAVEAWVSQGGASPALPVLAARMRELHRSAVPVPCPVDITAAELMPFLAGFASAEAHFGASHQGSPRFVINLRADDGPLLQLFHRTFGIGHLRNSLRQGLRRPRCRGSRPAERPPATRRVLRGLPRGRAGYVYAVWRELVRLELGRPRSGARSPSKSAADASSCPDATGSSARRWPSAGGRAARKPCGDGLAATITRAASWTTSAGAGPPVAPRHRGAPSPPRLARGWRRSRRWASRRPHHIHARGSRRSSPAALSTMPRGGRAHAGQSSPPYDAASRRSDTSRGRPSFFAGAPIVHPSLRAR